MGMKSGGGGKIVQVEGGHIVLSTGRKDRHSKVFTAKGPRDRRVRLAAHTAIQFYDVQDRLGYDRPSMAVDWLINKAKTAIDKLAELPPWNPTVPAPDTGLEEDEEEENPGVGSNEMSVDDATRGYNFQVQNPQLVDDLGLSLHSFQDQSLIQGQSLQINTSHSVPSNEQTLFSAPSSPTGFESACTFQRMMGWGTDAGGANPAQFYNQLQQQQQQQAMMLGHGPAFSQRGTLQSSFFQSVRAWNDLAMVSADHSRSTQDLHHQSPVSEGRFETEGLSSGFAIPVPIRGEDEQSPSVVSDRQTSSSSPVSQQ